jgi:predicted enzyme related to lactoylglutathione lyase
MSSLVFFSVDVGRLAAFYESVLGVTSEHDPWGGIGLLGEGVEILVHPVPEAIAATIEIQTPPEPLEGAAIKPVFDVHSLDLALETTVANGGVDTGRTFSIDDLTFHDVLDPDGNVIQLRAQTPSPLA